MYINTHIYVLTMFNGPHFLAPASEQKKIRLLIRASEPQQATTAQACPHDNNQVSSGPH
jgi:hypothetical protein